MAELEPCPFCGREPDLMISPEESTNNGRGTTTYTPQHWYVCCSAADGRGGCGAAGGFAQSKDTAVRLWNTRTAGARVDAPMLKLPEPRQGYTGSFPNAYQQQDTDEANGWNACIEEVKRLNALGVRVPVNDQPKEN